MNSFQKLIILRSFQFSYKKIPFLFDHCDDTCSCLQKDCFGLDLISSQSTKVSWAEVVMCQILGTQQRTKPRPWSQGSTACWVASWGMGYIVLQLTSLRLGLIYFISCKFFRSLVGFAQCKQTWNSELPNLQGMTRPLMVAHQQQQ